MKIQRFFTISLVFRAKVLSAWNRLKYSKNVFNIDPKPSFSGINNAKPRAYKSCIKPCHCSCRFPFIYVHSSC
jgi:hypothetical protein